MRLLPFLFCLILLCLVPGLAVADEVRVPGPDGILLNAELFLPKGAPRGAPVLELHSCAGPNAERDAEWARRLAAEGHVVLLPDSYGSRGLTSQCSHPTRGVTSSGLRRQDTLAAARWLAARPPSGAVVLLGWSDGATTALSVMGEAIAPGLIRGVVAFSPGCSIFADRASWTPTAPLLIVISEPDRATSPSPCRTLADRLPGQVTLVTYEGSARDFDGALQPAKAQPRETRRRGLLPAVAVPAVNSAARDAAIRKVPAFIAALP